MSGVSAAADTKEIAVSVVVPVYNEQAVLPALFARLYAALDALARPYEVIFVDDGSRDRSAAELRRQFQARPDVTRVVYLRAKSTCGRTPASTPRSWPASSTRAVPPS